MKKRWKRDFLFIAVILLGAAVLWWLLRPSGEGAYVLVTVGGEEAGRYPLWEDRTVTIGDRDYNILRIENGSAAIVEANCGDHTCVRTGRISRAGECIICLPHRLEIRVVGGADRDVDVVVQ